MEESEKRIEEREEGVRADVARKLIGLSMPIEQIENVTGLPRREIEKLSQ
jgi:hypothetical protein